ncbi:MAG: YbhB/YbcL family Raf kinase inhibitor-like protein, partial [Gammaproteobacteria bacterium]
SWGAPPAETESFVLIVNDRDVPGGSFTHWLIYNIDPEARGLPEGGEAVEQPANGAGGVQGDNDFGRAGYGGPCPPGGNAHRYEFALSALDIALDLAPGASRSDVLTAMEGHILGGGSVSGTYQR